jgi:hypothetical protein
MEEPSRTIKKLHEAIQTPERKSRIGSSSSSPATEEQAAASAAPKHQSVAALIAQIEGRLQAIKERDQNQPPRTKPSTLFPPEGTDAIPTAVEGDVLSDSKARHSPTRSANPGVNTTEVACFDTRVHIPEHDGDYPFHISNCGGYSASQLPADNAEGYVEWKTVRPLLLNHTPDAQIELIAKTPILWEKEAISELLALITSTEHKLKLLVACHREREQERSELIAAGYPINVKRGKFKWVSKASPATLEASRFECLWNSAHSTTEKVLLAFAVGLVNEFATSMALADMDITTIQSPIARQCVHIAIDGREYFTSKNHRKYVQREQKWNDNESLLLNIQIGLNEIRKLIQEHSPDTAFAALKTTLANEDICKKELLDALCLAYLETFNSHTVSPDLALSIKNCCFYTLFHEYKACLVDTKTKQKTSGDVSHPGNSNLVTGTDASHFSHCASSAGTAGVNQSHHP